VLDQVPEVTGDEERPAPAWNVFDEETGAQVGRVEEISGMFLVKATDNSDRSLDG
jgi:hypothetical protein